MIIDQYGTQYRSGRLLLPDKHVRRPLQWWMPQGDKTHWKACIYSRRTGLLLWQRPFDDLVEALGTLLSD